MAATWRGTIERGLAESGAVTSRFSFELVYYADLLEERRDDWKCADDSTEIDPGDEPGPAALLAEWQRALADQGVPDGLKGEVSIPATPLWTQRAVHRLAASPGLQGLGETGIRRLARHMHAYLAHDEARRLILERLDAVAGSDPVTVLIGHSMGSVVAYEWSHTPASAHVGAGCLFLTLGSPLGSYPIARRLRPSPASAGTCELLCPHRRLAPQPALDGAHHGRPAAAARRSGRQERFRNLFLVLDMCGAGARLKTAVEEVRSHLPAYFLEAESAAQRPRKRAPVAPGRRDVQATEPDRRGGAVS
ncbi:hypothetical protein [Microbispora sp. H13382]|uniref:hypothetical protein n=1 Tax=Microbispora sp. H13382 TaxID=2729112 RepID=UPI001603D394|nr:hypothetical protein [Microbispora sp. H13382]